MDDTPPRLLLDPAGTAEVVQFWKVSVRSLDGAWDDVLIELSDGTYALAKTTELWPVAS